MTTHSLLYLLLAAFGLGFLVFIHEPVKPIAACPGDLCGCWLARVDVGVVDGTWVP